MADEDDVDDFLKEGAGFGADSAQKYEALRGRRGQERQMWEQWNQRGRKPEDLEPLLTSIDPIINREANKRVQGLGGRIPLPALKNELRNTAVQAIQSYDPTRKAQLTTHIHQNFMRVTDFIAKNRNTRRMPRNKVERYGEYENAKEEFKLNVGREPTQLEMQQLLPGWSKKLLGEMERGFGREVFSNMGTPLDGDYAEEDSVRGAYLMVRPMLTDAERQFGDKHYTAKGERPMEVQALARNLGVSTHKAYRIREKIDRRMAPILKNR